MNLAASPPTIQPASEPEVTSLTGAPLVSGDGDGNQVYVAFSSAPGAPLASWNASTPDQFSTLQLMTPRQISAFLQMGSIFVLQFQGRLRSERWSYDRYVGKCPLGIGTLSPSQGTAAGGTTLTIRGSGFSSGCTVAIGGKVASTTFKDINTLSVLTPALAPGFYRVMITNPDGATTSLDAAFTAN